MNLLKKRKSSKQYVKGDIVRCNYRGVGWIGVVYSSTPILQIIPMVDKSGKPQRKRFVKTYHPDWLEPAELSPEKIKHEWL